MKEVEDLLAEWSGSRAYALGEGAPAQSAETRPATMRSESDLPIRESFAYHYLSGRTQTRLELAGIRSINDLRTKTAEELLALWSFGTKCLSEVELLLEAHGHRLGEPEKVPRGGSSYPP